MIKLGNQNTWVKSSYSGPNGACVEIGSPNWLKSSYSAGMSNCVEVKAPTAAVVGIRDSKVSDSPVLVVSPSVFSTFVNSVRSS
jgi:hypothetical protein